MPDPLPDPSTDPLSQPSRGPGAHGPTGGADQPGGGERRHRSSLAGTSFAGTFRQKLPELILEAGSVVFAVLLALAVDEWRDGRELRRLTALAMTRVEEEVRANGELLIGARRSVEAATERLDSALTRNAREDSEIEIAIQLELPLLPSAAWQAAQMSLASAHLPLDWASRAAEAYEVQELYETRQATTFDLLTGGGPVGADEAPDEALARLRAQLATLLLLLDELETSYAQVLAARP